MMKIPPSIDAHISEFPTDVQEKLQKLRATIHAAAPEAKEKIAYGIPTFTFHGNLVHFAGYAHHIGFYPGPGAIDRFRSELTGYELSKGTIKFPIDAQIPYELIERIVKFRVEQNQNRRKK